TRSLSPARSHLFLLSCTQSPYTQLYSLSLHDALPILLPRDAALGDAPAAAGARSSARRATGAASGPGNGPGLQQALAAHPQSDRSEEHTSELQSRENLVCRLLLEKK